MIEIPQEIAKWIKHGQLQEDAPEEIKEAFEKLVQELKSQSNTNKDNA